MKLSVCIFTYNHRAYIAETIESALRQKTNFEYEIVVGEDCSTDGTLQIVEQYEKRYPQKVRAIYNKTNLGMMHNHSNTILQCKGEYIALLDGDDYWVEDMKLQNQVNFLDNNLRYSFCFHDGRVIMEDGSELRDSNCVIYKSSRDVFLQNIIIEVGIPTFSIVFRKNALNNYPPPWFETLNAPDRPLFLLLAEVGPGFYFDEIWGMYRHHSNGSWTGQDFQSRWLTLLQICRVVNRHLDYLYNKEFLRAQNKIYYSLAVDLARDKKIKRAKCFIRKYVNTNENSLNKIFTMFWKVLLFYKVLLKNHLRMHIDSPHIIKK